MTPVGFEPTISAGERPQTYALDRTAARTGRAKILIFNIPIYIIQYCISNKMQRYTVYFIWKLLYMFRVVPPPIIRTANV